MTANVANAHGYQNLTPESVQHAYEAPGLSAMEIATHMKPLAPLMKMLTPRCQLKALQVKRKQARAIHTLKQWFTPWDGQVAPWLYKEGI